MSIGVYVCILCVTVNLVYVPSWPSGHVNGRSVHGTICMPLAYKSMQHVTNLSHSRGIQSAASTVKWRTTKQPHTIWLDFFTRTGPNLVVSL